MKQISNQKNAEKKTGANNWFRIGEGDHRAEMSLESGDRRG